MLGIARLDLLVLTHFDHDHSGGVAAVVGRVDRVLHGPVAEADDERTLRSLQDDGAALTSATRGMTGVLGDARWRILWPRPDTPGGNDGSVTVEFSEGTVPSSLFLGDLSAAGQRAMATGAALLTAYDVVKVAHHGSADQDPALYARIGAALALVSVGPNTYGHPRAETLAMLATVGTFALRTDQSGLLAVWKDDTGLRAWRQRAPAAVAPDG